MDRMLADALSAIEIANREKWIRFIVEKLPTISDKDWFYTHIGRIRHSNTIVNWIFQKAVDRLVAVGDRKVVKFMLEMIAAGAHPVAMQIGMEQLGGCESDMLLDAYTRYIEYIKRTALTPLQDSCERHKDYHYAIHITDGVMFRVGLMADERIVPSLLDALSTPSFGDGFTRNDCGRVKTSIAGALKQLGAQTDALRVLEEQLKLEPQTISEEHQAYDNYWTTGVPNPSVLRLQEAIRIVTEHP